MPVCGGLFIGRRKACEIAHIYRHVPERLDTGVGLERGPRLVARIHRLVRIEMDFKKAEISAEPRAGTRPIGSIGATTNAATTSTPALVWNGWLVSPRRADFLILSDHPRSKPRSQPGLFTAHGDTVEYVDKTAFCPQARLQRICDGALSSTTRQSGQPDGRWFMADLLCTRAAAETRLRDRR